MLRIKIHRGSKMIGGSITGIFTEKTHIFIDFGSELNPDPNRSSDAEMIDMIQDAKCDAVLFTHYHGDHIGLMKHIPKNDIDGKIIKLGLGKIARQVLINIHETLSDFEDADKKDKEFLDILKDEERMLDIENGVVFSIGDIKITPILVDHSAYDAYMFILESDGKVIVHTGDFRTHGRLGEGLFDRIEKALIGKKVDVLITEGTMMSRLKENVLTEKQLQNEAIKVLSKPENKYAFLICSSTNVESLASFANAAMKLGRAFYVNHYVYKQIKLYRESARKYNYNLRFQKTYKFEKMEEINFKLGMTQPEFMMENGFLMLIGTSDAYKKRIDYFKDQDPLLIYSMWKDYIQRGKPSYDEKIGRLYHSWKTGRTEILHTSGHATVDDIRQMILTVKPQKYIIPIHTEKPQAFEELDLGEYSERIHMLNDGEIAGV